MSATPQPPRARGTAPPPAGTEPTLAPMANGTEPTLASGGAGTMPTLAAAGASSVASPARADYAQLVEIAPDHYDIERELARGGMGRIRLARDRRLARMVALKEVLVADGELARRFEREARITARLQHPSIVSVYEAGLWPNKAPFYAMPVVRGRSLDEVIAEKRTLAERMSLLPSALAVADALAYAHGERIIHRDLKPKNVLVGAFGETVVIDWGLAKDLAAGDAEISVRGLAAGSGLETAVGEVMGTPAYMPPEQADGAAVDERADVYAIGALLVHVLTGRPPYEGKTLVALLDQVRNQPPASVREREPSIAPDLAAIVERAMARDPAARYPTAKELADDLRRFQTGQLVAAHRYTLGEHLRRWVRKHRTAIAVALVATVGLLALGAISLQRIVHAQHVAEAERAVAQKQRAAADKERALAESNRGEAEDLVGFMIGDLGSKIRPLGKTDILDAVATKAIRYYDHRTEELGAAELGKRATALLALGDVLEHQGRANEALDQYRTAIAAATAMVAKDPSDSAAQIKLADSHAALGSALLALGDAPKGFPELEAANAIAVELSRLHPTDDTVSQLAANSAAKVGRAYLGEEDPTRALVAFRAALAIDEVLAARTPANDLHQESLWQAHIDVGDAAQAKGDAAAGHEELDTALAIALKRATAAPENASRQEQLQTSLKRVADLFAAEDRVDEAIPYYRQALTVSDALMALDPKNVSWRTTAAESHLKIGQCMYTGNPAGSVREYRVSIAMFEKVPGNDRLVKQRADERLAYVHQQTGNALLKLRDFSHATAEYKAALAIHESLAAAQPDDPQHKDDVATQHYKLGNVLRAKGDLRGALASYRKSVEVFEKDRLVTMGPKQQTEDADRHETIGDVLVKLRDVAGALAEYRTAISLGEAAVAAQPDVPRLKTYLDEYRARASALETKPKRSRR